MADIIGTASDDTLVGTTAADVIQGGAGRDKLYGGDGDDVVNGGDGNDYVYGDAGNDKLYGGTGNDTLVGDAGNDEIWGEDGNDGVFGGGGDDRVSGGAGTDTIYGDGGNDRIDGGADADKLYGGAGNDIISGGAGADLLDGGTGNDTFIWRAGEAGDTIIGGAGLDTIVFSMAAGDLTDAVKSDLVAFDSWLDGLIASSGGTAALAALATTPALSLANLGISVSGIEGFSIEIDGRVVALDDLLNKAPEAAPEQELATREDASVSGCVEARDANGDAVTFAVCQQPVSGTVTLDPRTGTFVYTPKAGFSGEDCFDVMVSDGKGGSCTQRVTVQVEAVADAPTLNLPTGGALVVQAGTVATGTDGNDIIDGTPGSDTIAGGAGDDAITGDASVTYKIALGIEADVTDTDGSETLTVEITGVPANAQMSAGTNLGGGRWLLSAAELAGVQILTSDPTNFTLTVTARVSEGASMAEVSQTLDVRFEGGITGADRIDGGSGNDTIVAGIGDDVVSGGLGNDVLDGGAGFDTVDFSSATNAVQVNLVSGTAAGQGSDTLRGFESVIGSGFDDTLQGDGNANLFADGRGNDYVATGAGDDRILAGPGGSDTYDGGAGFDAVDYSAAASGITLDLGSGKATGGAGDDKLFGIEQVTGSAFADTMSGGQAGDTMIGGGGADILRGGRGMDTLGGGEGADTFVFRRTDVVSGINRHGVDTILDFDAVDRLDFSDLVAKSSAANLADAIRLTETAQGTLVAVDFGGGLGFVDVVVLADVSGLDAQQMFADGQLVI